MKIGGDIARRQPRAVPTVLARVPFGIVRPVDAAGVYAFPTREVRRLEQAGALHRVATGYYAVVPPAAHGREWLPSPGSGGFRDPGRRLRAWSGDRLKGGSPA